MRGIQGHLGTDSAAVAIRRKTPARAIERASASRETLRRSGARNPCPQSRQRYFLLLVRSTIIRSNPTICFTLNFAGLHFGHIILALQPSQVHGASSNGFRMSRNAVSGPTGERASKHSGDSVLRCENSPAKELWCQLRQAIQAAGVTGRRHCFEEHSRIGLAFAPSRRLRRHMMRGAITSGSIRQREPN